MRKITTSLFGIVLAFASIPGQAVTCSRADLTGTWRLNKTGSPVNAFSPVVSAVDICKVTMPSTGSTIASTSTCRSYYFGKDVFNSTLTGSLNISSACRVTGTITITETNGSRSFAIDALLSSDKSDLSGVMSQSGTDKYYWSFTGFK